MTHFSHKCTTKATLTAGLLLVLMYVAWLWIMPFTTKGEPREAIVAVSMLAQHNWVLPTSIGADIPYKPPMLAWLIAAISRLLGGHVTEFTSRLPSALAMIVTALALLRFVAHRRGMTEAWLTVGVFATSMEVFRAATVCRVDMLLTMFTVLAIIALHRQSERHDGGTWYPSLLAAALMSGAVLTKGPVGMILPCGIAAVYRLLRGDNFFKTAVSLAVTATLSLVVPALWYAAAYRQGGETFLSLAIEENFGRMTGSMSYESHVNPWWYNVLTLLAGMLPITLLVILGVASTKYHKTGTHPKDTPGIWLQRFWAQITTRWHNCDSVGRIATVASAVIFIFYCIPASKRSVYLLPMYPFVALWVARYMMWLWERRSWAVKLYGWIIFAVGAAVAGAVLAGLFGMMPTAAPGKASMPGVWPLWSTMYFITWIVLAAQATTLPLLMSVLRSKAGELPIITIIATAAVYCLLQVGVLPQAMAYKTDRPVAEALSTLMPEGATVWQWRSAPMTRLYGVAFYSGDTTRLLPSDITQAEIGNDDILVVSDNELQWFADHYGQSVQLEPIALLTPRSGETKSALRAYRLHLSQPTTYSQSPINN